MYLKQIERDAARAGQLARTISGDSDSKTETQRLAAQVVLLAKAVEELAKQVQHQNG